MSKFQHLEMQSSISQNSKVENPSNENEDFIPGDFFRKSLFSTAIIIMYSAAAVGSSTILLFIPNLETISFFIFLVTITFGFKIGLQMMFTTTIIFEFYATSFYGFGGWLIFFKIISYSFIVVIGGFLHQRLQKRNSSEQNLQGDHNQGSRFYNMIFFFILGFTLTVIYDFITTLSLMLIVPSMEVLVINLIIGIPYYLFHEITNGLLFILVPFIASIIENHSIKL